MSLSLRPRSSDLCFHCHGTFIGDTGKEGGLPTTPSESCSLCRLLLASTSRIKALHLKALRSYSVRFLRLVEPEDVKRDEPKGRDSQLQFSIRTSDHEVAVSHGYTEFTRKPVYGGAPASDQGLKYVTTAEPHRFATLWTRLPLGTNDLSSQHVQMAPASTQIKERIQHIAQLCKERHDSCGKSLGLVSDSLNGKDFPYPVRLVRVEMSNGSHKTRLTEHSGELPSYACVSHRWFGDKQWKTMKATIDDAFTDIPFGSLPKTFQDAAIVAQSLGIDYLWIDSISIIQDDTDDWRQQSTQMGLIFQRSSYAFAAIDAFSRSEEDSGLLLARDAMPTEVTIRSSFSAKFEKVLAPLGSQATPETQDESDEEARFDNLSSSAWRGLRYELKHRYTSFDMSVERSPWNSRGWIFQERLLSPRILYFTKEQVFWECAAGILSESTELKGEWAKQFQVKTSDQATSDGIQNLHQLLRNHNFCAAEAPPKPGSDRAWSFTWEEHESLQLWWRITERYSECTLTFSKDRWFAIAGLCEILQARYGSEIHAGIWGIGVGAGLLWHARDSYLRPFEEFTAPSWSWMNLDGYIAYSYDDKSYTSCIQKVFPLIERYVFNVSMTTGPSDRTGHGFAGGLDLVCPTKWASVSKVKFGDLQFRETTGQATAIPAWRYFTTVSDGRSALELAREYRSMGLPPMTRLLYSAVGEAGSNETPRAVGWVVLDRDVEPVGPVLCALIVRRDLYGAKGAQQQVVECVVLVGDDAVDGEDGGARYRRIGRGRIVESGFLNEAKSDTIRIV